MLSVEEAFDRVIQCFHVLDSEEKNILDALGQVLATDICSPIDIPPMTNSAMDGYAVRYIDTEGANQQHPNLLQVIDHIAAGQLPQTKISPHTAIRIMTGAPIPSGADAVVPFENTDEKERSNSKTGLRNIGICSEVDCGENIRPSGEDIKQGELTLAKGTNLRPYEIGVLASIGVNTVKVIRRPQIALLATGDELITPDKPVTPGKIFDSNSYSLMSAITDCGGIPKHLGIAKDTTADVHSKLDKGLNADLIITSAGVSKGDYDVVKDVLSKRGNIDFWSVRMRPAKPLAFGFIDGANGKAIPHLGLPGNPVSCIIAFEVFGRPAILKMLGKSNLHKRTIQAILKGSIANPDKRRVFARVRVSKQDEIYYATPTGPQGSNILTSMSKANGLAICHENIPFKSSGDSIKVILLDSNDDFRI